MDAEDLVALGLTPEVAADVLRKQAEALAEAEQKSKDSAARERGEFEAWCQKHRDLLPAVVKCCEDEGINTFLHEFTGKEEMNRQKLAEMAKSLMKAGRRSKRRDEQVGRTTAKTRATTKTAKRAAEAKAPVGKPPEQVKTVENKYPGRPRPGNLAVPREEQNPPCVIKDVKPRNPCVRCSWNKPRKYLQRCELCSRLEAAKDDKATELNDETICDSCRAMFCKCRGSTAGSICRYQWEQYQHADKALPDDKDRSQWDIQSIQDIKISKAKDNLVLHIQWKEDSDILPLSRVYADVDGSPTEVHRRCHDGTLEPALKYSLNGPVWHKFKDTPEFKEYEQKVMSSSLT